MTDTPIENRLAVCSWSLQASTPQELAERLQATGISRVQLALDPLRENPAVWGETEAVLKQAGITIVSGMFGCVGEDYSTLDTIRLTGGIAPDATWEQNLENIRATVGIATALGLKLVTFHAGFVPHDPADPGFRQNGRTPRAPWRRFSPPQTCRSVWKPGRKPRTGWLLC